MRTEARTHANERARSNGSPASLERGWRAALERAFRPPGLEGGPYVRIAKAHYTIRVIISFFGIGVIWYMPGTTTHQQLTGSIILGLVFLPLSVGLLALSRRSTSKYVGVFGLVLDLSVVLAFQLIVPPARLITLFAYFLILAFEAFVGGMLAGGIAGLAAVAFTWFSQTVAPSPPVLSGVDLIMFGVFLASVTALLNVANKQQRRGAEALKVEVAERAETEEKLRALVEEHEQTESTLRTLLADKTRAQAELARSEAQLRIARDAAEESSRMKSEFLATMSHEIRTPLNGIIGMTSILLDSPQSHEQREYLETVRKSGDALLGLINDILDLSKVETGKIDLEKTRFNVPALIKETVDLFSEAARQKNLELSTTIDPAIPQALEGDAARLRQILMNLIGNALKFTESGGVIVKCSCEGKGKGLAYLRFEVIDTGIGIPADKHKSIFEMFSQADASTTRRYGGTGLGLSICQRFVELMGGEIGVESRPGKGSTFWFTLSLPVLERAEQGLEDRRLKHQAAAPRIASGAVRRILVAEDNAINQKVVGSMLRRAGYDVEFAEDGRRAVEAVGSGDYCAILMDCRMPVMDGYEATRLIRAQEDGRRIPIIAVTASAMESDREQCLSAGMDDFLPKPIRQAELLSVIHKWSDRAA